MQIKIDEEVFTTYAQAEGLYVLTPIRRAMCIADTAAEVCPLNETSRDVLFAILMSLEYRLESLVEATVTKLDKDEFEIELHMSSEVSKNLKVQEYTQSYSYLPNLTIRIV